MHRAESPGPLPRGAAEASRFRLAPMGLRRRRDNRPVEAACDAQIVWAGAGPVLELHGVLTMSSAAPVTAALAGLLQAGHRQIEVSMAALRAVDLAGLFPLLATGRLLADQGGGVRVRTLSPAAAAVLDAYPWAGGLLPAASSEQGGQSTDNRPAGG